jgi:hypothetical protein
MASHGPVRVKELNSGLALYVGGARVEQEGRKRYEMLSVSSKEIGRVSKEGAVI